ncbi:MAG: acyl carrier protein [Magnetococcales bacterium]|nr:acyl carrier protein [Magnetococcales bacterium]NGZ06889.1 acyl carrier protein [Magnetococcales bacterium]
MSPETILERIGPILRATFQDPNLKIDLHLTMDDVPAWDSIGHMTLIAAVEQEFRFQCSLEELVHVRSIGDLVNLVADKSPDGS